MLKVGLVGIGFMGRGHLDIYLQLQQQGYPVVLTAICDIDAQKFNNKFTDGNLDMGNQAYDFTPYRLYTSLDEMLAAETFDFVDICLPTYLHAEATVKALAAGAHVLCEKPMALSLAECQQMIDAAERAQRKLLIGQCLRFWPEYEYLKSCIDEGTYGKPLSGTFFRGGVTPEWSYNNWMLRREQSGGCILDQHIHDVDIVQWVFGKPDSVTTVGKIVVPGSGYDTMSTNYIYKDGPAINTRGDWTLNGDQGFIMSYGVNFEHAYLSFERGVLRVHPNKAESFVPELAKEGGHYREIKYFIEAILNDTPIETATPESTMYTIELALAEVESADRSGALIAL